LRIHCTRTRILPATSCCTHVIRLDVQGGETKRVHSDKFVEIVIDECPVERSIKSHEHRRVRLFNEALHPRGECSHSLLWRSSRFGKLLKREPADFKGFCIS